MQVLTGHDKCDHNDNATAQARWTKGALTLDMCGHHSHTDGPALLTSGFQITGMDPVTLEIVKAKAAASVSA